MKRFFVGVVICSLAALPVHAQDGGREDAGAGSQVTSGVHLDFHAIVAEKATAIAAFQVPQAQQPPPPPRPGPTGPEHSKNEKIAYFATLAGAAVGVIYNIHTTRDALDHGLEARTFPLVWKKTKDPNDKGKVSGIIAGANGGLLAVGGIVYYKGNGPLATFLNVLVGGGTGIIGLRNRSVINDCISSGNCK